MLNPAPGSRRYVVTAGAGFLGSAVVESLAADGHAVVCLDRPDRLARLSALPAGVTAEPYVLGAASPSLAGLAGADAVVHLAHRGLPSSPAEREGEEAAANSRGLDELVAAVREGGVGRVVMASSGGTVYGQVDRLPVDESYPTRPISAYGAAKLRAEHALHAAAAVDGFGAVSLRIGNAVGPGQLRGAGVGAPAKFLAEVAAGRPVTIWGDGGIVRDYVGVDDIVAAVRLAADRDLPTGPYNVGSEQGTSLDELLAVVEEVTERPVEVHREPSRAFDVPSIVLDCGRFRAATGWRAEADLRPLLRRMWALLTEAV